MSKAAADEMAAHDLFQMDMTHSNARHDSSICDMTRPYPYTDVRGSGG